jgi:hypothetical protein
VVPPTRVTAQGWRPRKAYDAFFGDISSVCSRCYFMVPDHVTCMFKAVELWTEFETWMLLIM